MSNAQKQNTFFGGAAILAVGIVLTGIFAKPIVNAALAIAGGLR